MRAATLTINLIAFAFAIAVVGSRFARYRRLRLDHVVLFSLGHAYYLSLSAIMYQTRWLNGTYSFVYRWYFQASDLRMFLSGLWSLLLLLSFVGGSYLAGRGRPVGEPVEDSPAQAQLRLAPAIALLGVVFAGFCMVAVVYRGIILGGYQSLDPQEIQEQAGRGVLSAAASSTVLCAIFLLDVIRRCRMTRPPYLLWLMIAFTIFVPSALLLLSGGRMYVATSLLALAVWFTHVRRPLARSLMLGAGLGGFLVLTAMGSLRTGALPDRTTVGFYATSESALTGISNGRFLSSPREVFLPVRVPKYLASDLSNLVPRAIFPAKDDLRFDPEDDGYTITSSLGAVQLPVSAIINFGYVGSLAVFGALGFGLSRLRRRVVAHPTAVWTIAYACMSATLMFSIYRDPFSISVVRWMILNAVVVPGLYVLAVAVTRRRAVVRPLARVSTNHTTV